MPSAQRKAQLQASASGRRGGDGFLGFACCAGRGSKFLECAQEGYGVVAAQHSDDLLSPDDGHLVYSVAIHILEGGPQLRVRIGAFQLFEGKHDISGARCSPFLARYLFDSMQGYQTEGLVSPVDQETTLPTAEDLLVDQLPKRQSFRDNGVTRTHGLRNRWPASNP